VKPEDFEKFVIEEVYSLPQEEGEQVYLLKGDKGDRVGKYLFMLEFESVEARDRLGRLSALEPDARAVWEKMLGMADLIFIDYVVVGK
jgi:hypothetical protein